jgi:hypothetical protein
MTKFSLAAAARTFVLICVALVSMSTANGQAATPGVEASRPAPPRGPRPAPVNIKALPKNISGEELIKLMRQYEGDLGVQCQFCHAQNPTKRSDFVSDANPRKDVARYMITMTADLNDKYLAEMPNRMYADPITCGTCHRGAKHPTVFTPTAQAPDNRPPGPPPAVAGPPAK